MDELLKWRSEFPILERTTYMISNSLGAMPRGVRERMAHYADTWATRGVRAWEEEWWEPKAAHRQQPQLLYLLVQPNQRMAGD